METERGWWGCGAHFSSGQECCLWRLAGFSAVQKSFALTHSDFSAHCLSSWSVICLIKYDFKRCANVFFFFYIMILLSVSNSFAFRCVRTLAFFTFCFLLCHACPRTCCSFSLSLLFSFSFATLSYLLYLFSPSLTSFCVAECVAVNVLSRRHFYCLFAGSLWKTTKRQKQLQTFSLLLCWMGQQGIGDLFPLFHFQTLGPLRNLDCAN